MTMDDFEALVFSQRPASAPWQPVTDYSFRARKDIEGEHPAIIKRVFQPRFVLDAGCGPEGHLVGLLCDIGVPAWGFDVQIPQTHLNLMPGDLLNPPGGVWGDLVICREVLEHLTLLQCRLAITNLCRLSSRFVYVTTRFSSEHNIMSVDTMDDLDPTHITIPSKDLIRLLFVLEGFKRRADLEARLDWQNKNRCLVYERIR